MFERGKEKNKNLLKFESIKDSLVNIMLKIK